MDTPITHVSIVPSYALGFTYIWTISDSLEDSAPWKFVIELASGPNGPWKAISPTVTNMYRWSEDTKRLINKDDVLYFRIKMITPENTYYSAVITPYGDLEKREYLLVKEVMRKELLHAQTLAGVKGQLWLVSTFGPKCRKCVDPITKQIRDSSCPACMGTGRLPPYNGPYETFWLISPTTRTMQMSPDGTGTREPKQFEIRMIGTPPSKKNDVVVDINSGKRYYVDVVQVVAELQGIPVVQTLIAHEAPVSDVAYQLGYEQ